MGTPAEEGGGGKILMLEKGCFDNVDYSMMVHPAPFDAVYSQSLAVQNVYVTFKGRPAHAAAFPWEGVNALDAAVFSYNAISMLRQQIKPTWRAHGVFTKGGIEPAIIPETIQLHYYFRAPSLKELEEFKAKAESCFRGAAETTGEGLYYHRLAYSLTNHTESKFVLQGAKAIMNMDVGLPNRNLLWIPYSLSPPLFISLTFG